MKPFNFVRKIRDVTSVSKCNQSTVQVCGSEHPFLVGTVPVYCQKELLYFGSIRMNILMLDTRNVEQTKDVRMYT